MELPKKIMDGGNGVETDWDTVFMFCWMLMWSVGVFGFIWFLISK